MFLFISGRKCFEHYIRSNAITVTTLIICSKAHGKNVFISEQFWSSLKTASTSSFPPSSTGLLQRALALTRTQRERPELSYCSRVDHQHSQRKPEIENLTVQPFSVERISIPALHKSQHANPRHLLQTSALRQEYLPGEKSPEKVFRSLHTSFFEFLFPVSRQPAMPHAKFLLMRYHGNRQGS